MAVCFLLHFPSDEPRKAVVRPGVTRRCVSVKSGLSSTGYPIAAAQPTDTSEYLELVSICQFLVEQG
jgi:hypothetical protein